MDFCQDTRLIETQVRGVGFYLGLQEEVCKVQPSQNFTEENVPLFKEFY